MADSVFGAITKKVAVGGKIVRKSLIGPNKLSTFAARYGGEHHSIEWAFSLLDIENL